MQTFDTTALRRNVTLYITVTMFFLTALAATLYTQYQHLNTHLKEDSKRVESGIKQIIHHFILDSIKELYGFRGMMFTKEESLTPLPKQKSVLLDGYRVQSSLSKELLAMSENLKAQGSLQSGMEIAAGGKMIIEKHLHGSITAYNKEDGVCFEITLPHAKQENIK